MTTVGLLLGSNLDRAIRLVSRAGYAGLGIAAILAAAFVVWNVRRRGLERSESVDVPVEPHPTQQRSRR